MNRVTRGQKTYFAAVGLLALWVGVWGYFIPGRVDQALPWLVPPLHARFLGAMYLSATTLMVGCILARRYAEVQAVVPMITIWTGMLFVVSLLHLGEFDYSRPQVWIWFGAYLIYPLIALWFTWLHRTLRDEATGPGSPGWVRAYLLAHGSVTTALALALLFAPGLMASVWPWKITPLLAQIYSGPFLSYGLGSLMLCRRRTWPEIRVAVAGTFVFAFGVLLASTIHRVLFSALNPATWLWFGGFLLTTAMLGFLTVRAIQARGST